MDWTNKNVNPSKVVHIGEEVEVMVLDIDEERRRISLGIKQCKPNPWREFADNYNRGDKVAGQIKSITDFGMFIGLPGGIDGLVHLSDISWDVPGEEAVRNYQKGQTVEAIVLSRSTRSASASRSASSSWPRTRSRPGSPSTRRAASSAASCAKWTPRARSSTSAAASKATCAPPSSSRDRVEDARAMLKVGDEVEAKFTGVDRKVRTIALSIKAKDMAEEQEAMQSYRSGLVHRHEPGRPAQGADLRPVTSRGGCGGGSEPVAAAAHRSDRSDCGESREWTASAA